MHEMVGVKTTGDPWNIVVDMGPLPIFGTAEATGLTFCVRTEGGGPNENYAKLDHRESGQGLVT